MQFFQAMLGHQKNQTPEPPPPQQQPKQNTGCSHGGDTRMDGRVSFGYSLMRGKRASMEDFYFAQFKGDDKGNSVGLFGVFDGHGGPNAASFVKSTLFESLLANPKFSTDMKSALVESFIDTDKKYLQNPAGGNRDDGCTAVTAVLVGQKLFVANVGDSRAVLSRGGKAFPLSVDHKPNRQDERSRIEDAGGVVVWAGTWRVGGVLAVSRAFGDRLLKRYVVATPDLQEEDLTTEDETAILASDGLWDVVSNQDAITLIKDIKDAEAAAKRLAEEAFSRGSNDNISCIVLRFKF